MLTVYLKDGAQMSVNTSMRTFEKALEKAAQNGGFVHIHSQDGRTFAVNPSNVSLIETEEPDATPNGGAKIRPLAEKH